MRVKEILPPQTQTAQAIVPAVVQESSTLSVFEFHYLKERYSHDLNGLRIALSLFRLPILEKRLPAGERKQIEDFFSPPQDQSTTIVKS